MKELTLKHIAPYAPYKLGIILPYDDECNVVELEGFDLYQPGTLIAERINYYITKCKLRLRPLSDITSIEEILDEMSDNEKEIVGMFPNWTGMVNHDAVQLMFKHHIDVFGLIPLGFAVNINLK